MVNWWKNFKFGFIKMQKLLLLTMSEKPNLHFVNIWMKNPIHKTWKKQRNAFIMTFNITWYKEIYTDTNSIKIHRIQSELYH